MSEAIESEFGLWGIAVAWVFMFGAFVLFVPLYRKADRRPAGAFMAFVVAFALEMYGAPLSLYLVMWVFGKSLPYGVLWGHTLSEIIGPTGHYLFLAALPVGGALVVGGWAKIHRDYWSREDGEGRLVKDGVYCLVRHPQYTGFLLISLAVLLEWATLLLLILWPVLAVLYWRLARREERELERRFDAEWREYAAATGMFLPRLLRRILRRRREHVRGD